MPIRYLSKRRYGNRGDGSKYYIDCSVYQHSPESIQTELLLRNVDRQNVAIIRAVVTDDTIRKKNKQIVVKITPVTTPTNEYEMGELLYQHKIPGFIRYLCHFPCYDDTAETSPKISAIQPARTFSKRICQASHEVQNKKDVLVMHLFVMGRWKTFLGIAKPSPFSKIL